MRPKTCGLGAGRCEWGQNSYKGRKTHDKDGKMGNEGGRTVNEGGWCGITMGRQGVMGV